MDDPAVRPYQKISLKVLTEEQDATNSRSKEIDHISIVVACEAGSLELRHAFEKIDVDRIIANGS